ncbi:transcription initiation factor IIF, beta subunit [Aspergillus sclerotiicarbonarius CBS 121057]|uniref:Transcription initiation factor IIF subunit beta n=1 Tax=Aspergillus sclerotiicarbonarius (strain CBS 121057 / IBT 28362) TaxID=1448318 RepID=A0A319FCB7_ASPSB|nr:transcription initiation factor IIF, beta subunit [Aspergillus sclerotiicarbonarius CBS 121057]
MVPQVKQDPDAQSPYIKSDPYIKQDPDSKDAILDDIDDEDLYEDAGDLDFSAANQNVWLSRIPRSLWEHWSHLSNNGGDDDEEIQIGTMRIEGTPNDIKRVSLRLNGRDDNHEIPKDYLLQRQTITAENVSHLTQNTYLFTERDIPGHENRMVVFGEARSALYESMKREMKKKERKKKWEPYVRKTVPKQTALVGSVGEEFNCLPVENEEFRLLSEKKALEALKPKRETVFIDKIPGKLLQPRNALPGEKGAFVQATRPLKAKAQENKTTRMPQNELLDLIYQCFREYKYWPFKNLKARLRQPEAYLKQTLEMIAHLVKAGDFAMTWELKPEARESNYSNAMYSDAKEELAPGLDYNFDDASDEEATPSGMVTDNDDAQFENAL